MIETSPDHSPTKQTLSLPEYNNGIISTKNESSRTLSSKMRKILASPKVMRGKSIPSVNKTFGVPLEFLFDRDGVDVPFIVTRICEYLKAHGMSLEGLFRVNGNMKVVERLKVAFDKCGDADLEEIGDVPAAASLLKMFLRELSDPVVPEDLQKLFINIQDKYSKDKLKLQTTLRELVKQMPRLNAYLLKYLCEFMLTIASRCDKNKMTALALAIVFGPNIFRCGEGLEGLREQAFVNAVLLHLLQEFQEIFLIDNDMFPDSKMSAKAPEKPLPYLEHVKQKNEKEKNKEKPARPPPPQLNLKENINLNKVQQEANTSPKKVKSNQKSPRRNSKDKIKTPNKRKGSSNGKEATRSSSPTMATYSSPMTKQLVDTTINSAVKEYLFGPGMTSISIDSEHVEDSMVIESPTMFDPSSVYPSVKDKVKSFDNSHGKTSNITDRDFDFIEQKSRGTLDVLTRERAKLPTNRRKPSFRSQTSNNDDDQSPSHTYPPNKTNVSKRLFRDRTNEKQDEFNQPMVTSERLKSLQRNIPPLKKTNTVPPLSIERLESINSMNIKKSNSTDQLRENNVASIIPILDLSRLQEEEVEAPKSPRGRYKIFTDEDDVIRSPHSPTSSPHLKRNSPSQSVRRHEVWNERRQDTVPIVEMSPQDLKKRILALKKIIQNFESNFETTNGHKPRPGDKTHIQKYIAELGRAKKQRKELLSDYNENAEFLSDTAPIASDFGTAPNLRESLNNPEIKSKEDTLHTLLKRLEEKRLLQGRPQEIQLMTVDQLRDEKLSVQKALLQYENLHGRPTTKDDKTLMRPLYDRYRKIKRMIATGRSSDSLRRSIDHGYSDTSSPRHHLSSPPESPKERQKESIHEAGLNDRNTQLSLSPLHHISPKRSQQSIRGNSLTKSISIESNEPNKEYGLPHGLADTFSVTNRFSDTTDEPFSPVEGDSPRSIDEAILHNATISELLEQQRNTKKAKKRLGKLLKEYEDEFFNLWNRKVQKDDRLPKEAEYREYKLIKSKLRLVDALIAKKAANQTV